MKQLRFVGRFTLASSLAILAGCTYTLVQDIPNTPHNVVAHCEGTEPVDDSSMAVIPIPFVAFLSPRSDLNVISAEDYLNRCGPPSELVNRTVTLNKNACIPASLTELVTFGVWQWCPARVAWSADITSAAARATSSNEMVGETHAPRSIR